MDLRRSILFLYYIDFFIVDIYLIFYMEVIIMNIRDDCIRLFGFDKFTEIFKSIRKLNETMITSQRGNTILNELMVCIDLEDVNFIEFLTLKGISKDILVKKTNINANYIPDDTTNTDIFRLLTKLQKEINTEESKSLEDPLSLLPVNIFSMDITVLLSGSQILFLSNGTIEDLILRGHNIKTEEEIKSDMLNKFPKAFYDFMNHYLNSYDFVSEVTLQSMFYDYSNKRSSDTVTAVQLRGVDDVIQFSGGNKDLILASFEHMKSSGSIYTSELSLSCYSNISTFAQFVIYSNYVTGFIPLRNVLGENKFGIDSKLSSRYSSRISSTLKEFMSIRTDHIKDPKYAITRFCWLLCADKINYQMRIPINDIHTIDSINKLSDKRVNNMINQIKKISKPFIS